MNWEIVTSKKDPLSFILPHEAVDFTCDLVNENEIPHLNCEECGQCLAAWYCYIIHQLKEFIPEWYEHYCCDCAKKHE